ncbi:alanine-zipper protein [Dichelobacter nodosus]|uniref:Hypothetical lipoprotein n=1 Tax=Dichelobacter nodosus (strain VCS1703A) TaxID=246195 RepID=A5EXZ0_DICNV|nr:alanine-zipper protein [Dichelobacter nodosus]ABQ13158.1 hypothetical lipoprotein [Dichelobacter nodosus VCS1703A]AXM45790.1 hypothetical protein DYQ38_04780 [Dichelobacter nodosus]KNZ39242.1 hypothetical protein AKG33_05855 [Dichelobacter nodosus]TGA64448.1 hypothetical protein E5E99_04775 [Dichelobacter nodosus]
MKKLIALSAVALLFTGCASQTATDNTELASLRASIEEARAAAVQANQTSQQALQLAQQNAAKIDRVFTKSQLK